MKRGLSIIEIMIFIAILTIAVIGTSGYRYFATMDIRRSDNEITAGRIASQLCQSWKGIGGGNSSYSPLPANDGGIGLSIEASTSTYAPEKPSTFTLLKDGGYYKIVSDNNSIYYATMSYHITNGAHSSDPNLETLNVIVSWSKSPSNNNAATKSCFYLTDLLMTN
jgi:hypothetical protein